MKNSYHPYAISTIIMWAFAFIFTQFGLEHFSVYALGFLRYFVASIVLIVVVFIKRLIPPRLADIPLFILCGALGFFSYMLLFNLGASTTSSATGSVIMAIMPLITALLAVLLFKEKLKGFQWVAFAIEFAGIVVLTLIDGIFSMNIGVLWLLLAAVSLSLYNLLQRKLTRNYSGLTATTYSIFAGTLMLAIFAPQSFAQLSTAPLKPLLSLLVLGVFCSALAYVLWSVALQKAPNTSYVSNYMFLTPLLTSVIGFLLAGEVPTLSTVIGGIAIISGAVLFNKDSFLRKKSS